jgi:hypothetical protein
MNDKKRRHIGGLFFGVCIFWCPVLQAGNLKLKGNFVMQKTAVTRVTYFGFYFYFGRGAPVIC